jgi:ligand-binding SRPBCC domain-containing protein
MPRFEKRSRIAASPARVFAFHEAPDALERLTPPWESARIIERSGDGIQAGARIVLEARVGPIKMRWIAEHTRYEKDRLFQDVQRAGPFARWEHTHIVEPDGEGGCWLIDSIDYELPFGKLGALFDTLVARRLQRMFDYRHEVTRRACEAKPITGSL